MSEDGDDRQFFPATVVIQGARLKEGHTAYYLLLCSTPAQQQWGVAKRFSEFSALRDTLVDARQDVYGVPFPSKTWFGGGNGVETVEERRSQLETWMNSVLHLCPMDKEILGFLAEDGSVAREELGLPPETPEKPPAADDAPGQELERAAETDEGAEAPEAQRGVDDLVADLTVPFADVLLAKARSGEMEG